MRIRRLISCTVTVASVFYATLAWSLTLPSAFSGSDEAFEPLATVPTTVSVDLGAAATGPWATTAGAGAGVYDAEQWAVIFRYSRVSIPANVTVNFQNHPSRAPVIWLVEGDVTINGVVSLNGGSGASTAGAPLLSEPGPGGFRGGRGARTGSEASAGMGPGGGILNGGLGGYTYGNEGIFPLIGGSGGAGASNAGGGGAGGGAILIATTGTITINGTVRANGGSGSSSGGSGSGGGIRLIANAIQGTTGVLQATGPAGTHGRIRLEAVTNSLPNPGSPPYSFSVPASAPRIFRVAADGVPAIRSVTLGGQPVPADPKSRLEFPLQDVSLTDAGTATLAIEAENVPPGSTVKARVVRQNGQATEVTAQYGGQGAGPNQSLWSADVSVASGFSTIVVRAQLP